MIHRRWQLSFWEDGRLCCFCCGNRAIDRGNIGHKLQEFFVRQIREPRDPQLIVASIVCLNECEVGAEGGFSLLFHGD